ncbi:MAG: DUF3365 domain-containing protein [Gemmatimonadota bacterium]|nr:MAG: DUF3365 domain-containing protein [Gemmatimonadota bacterium]
MTLENGRTPVGRHVVHLAPLLLVCLAAVACSRESLEVTPDEEQWVSTVGHEAASSLTQGLVARLLAAIEEGGPARAVDVCSNEALQLTAEIRQQMANGIELKRTSFKYRNPANAPDSLETAAITHFVEMLASQSELPPYHVQQVARDTFRYYQPLVVNQLCVQCHGTPETMSPEVQAQLAARYPDDRAVGYSVGELRGVIRVSIPASVLEEQ